jgi:hypothetical protein
MIEHLPGASEDLIAEHAEVADIAFWLSIALGLGSIVMLTLRNRAAGFYEKGVAALLVLSVITSGALAYTAFEGGKIRHPEAYSDISSATHDED